MRAKIKIPPHVIPPSDAIYLTTTKYPEMNTSSLGYALLRALGASEQMDDVSLNTLIQWTNKMHLKTGGLTPNTDKLENVTKEKSLLECVRERLGPKYKTDITCVNAARFRGDKRKPSYQSLYSEVWETQTWEDLCNALSSPC